MDAPTQQKQLELELLELSFAFDEMSFVMIERAGLVDVAVALARWRERMR